MSNDHGLVTPEAVRLDLPTATVGSRGAAIIVDWLLQGLALLLLSVAAGFAQAVEPSWLSTSIVLILSFLVVFGYPTAFETVTRGRTPGKMLLGLRVVTVEGAPVRFRHAAIRAALGTVDFSLTFGVAAVVSSLVSRRNQRLGDFVAGTVVLRERVAASTTRAQRFDVPSAATAVAGSIDASGLTARDYAAVRSYLLRVDGLPTERRDEIGRQLLSAIGPRLGTLPAVDLPPEQLLRTIAARYQERTAARSDDPR